MKKWYDEEYEWEIEVIGFNKDNDDDVSDYGSCQKRRRFTECRWGQ